MSLEQNQPKQPSSDELRGELQDLIKLLEENQNLLALVQIDYMNALKKRDYEKISIIKTSIGAYSKHINLISNKLQRKQLEYEDSLTNKKSTKKLNQKYNFTEILELNRDQLEIIAAILEGSDFETLVKDLGSTTTEVAMINNSISTDLKLGTNGITDKFVEDVREYCSKNGITTRVVQWAIGTKI